MPLARPRLQAALLLPLRPLPTPHFRQAFRLPAISLVIPPCLELPAASLPQTVSPPQPSPTGRNALACRKMRLSHGSAYSLGSARGEVAFSPGTPLSTQDSACRGRAATLPALTVARFAEGPPQRLFAYYQNGRRRRRRQGRRRLRYARPRRRREGDQPLEGNSLMGQRLGHLVARNHGRFAPGDRGADRRQGARDGAEDAVKAGGAPVRLNYSADARGRRNIFARRDFCSRDLRVE